MCICLRTCLVLCSTLFLCCYTFQDSCLENGAAHMSKYQTNVDNHILKHSFSEFREGVKSISFNYGKAI